MRDGRSREVLFVVDAGSDISFHESEDFGIVICNKVVSVVATRGEEV